MRLAALTRLSDRSRIVLLAVIAALSAAIYLPLTLAMSLHEFFPGPGVTLDFQYMLGDDWQRNWIRLHGSFAALLLLWGAALALAAHLRATRAAFAVVAAGGLAMAASLVPMYPPFAVDFFHYLGEGRLLWVEGENPMTTGPGAYFPIGMSYGDEAPAYGPLWFWLLGPPVLAGGDDFPLSLYLLKTWMVLWVAAAAFLGILVSRRLSPGRELLVAVAIAWNPYVLWRVAGNGHNDIVLVVFILFALWAAVTERWRWLLPALAASVLVKYVSVLVLPAFAIYLLRRPPETRRALVAPLAIGAAGALTLAVVAFAPMWDGLEVFDPLRTQADRIISSTPGLLSFWLQADLDVAVDTADNLARAIGGLAFALAAAALLWRQSRGAMPLIAVTALLPLAYLVFALGWFRPWYYLWIIPLMPLLPGRWWIALLVTTSVAGLAPDVLEKYSYRVSAFEGWYVPLPAILGQFGPPALAWLIALAASRSATLIRSSPTAERPHPLSVRP